jgi:probable RNA-binding protein EIF1AD
MPTKFRKNVWIKRGNYVLVETIEEGSKVKAEIVRVLTDDHQKEFSKHGIWPKKWTKKRELEEECSDDSENQDKGLHRNLNRKAAVDSDVDQSSSESD